jgi:hypothetical protein
VVTTDDRCALELGLRMKRHRQRAEVAWRGAIVVGLGYASVHGSALRSYLGDEVAFERGR